MIHTPTLPMTTSGKELAVLWALHMQSSFHQKLIRVDPAKDTYETNQTFSYYYRLRFKRTDEILHVQHENEIYPAVKFNFVEIYRRRTKKIIGWGGKK